MAGTNVYLKLENLQKTGSFKIRGAANKLIQLTEKERQCGVIAASAGNHAQGVAYMATKLGIKCVIVMPELSPLIKVVSTQKYGAEVILKGAIYDEAYQHALELQKKHGYILIHPFEDEKVIAGQATIGLEIHEALPDVDTIFVPIGGGGLVTGIALALKELKPNARVIGVQAEGASSMAHSFKDKKLDHSEEQRVSTIADGIAVKRPSAVMYEEFISKLCEDVVTVNDDQLAQAIVFLMERSKTVVEGAGAVATAALLNVKYKSKMKNAVAILSGGNIDLNILERVIDRGLQVSGRLAKIVVSAPDVPGTLNKLTGLIASKKANILQINHNRLSQRIDLRETIIEFLLETSSHTQIEEIKEGFRKLNSKILE